jgi:hypothetical protein
MMRTSSPSNVVNLFDALKKSLASGNKKGMAGKATTQAEGSGEAVQRRKSSPERAASSESRRLASAQKVVGGQRRMAGRTSSISYRSKRDFTRTGGTEG